MRVERVEVPVLDEKLVARIEKALDPAASLLAEAQETLLRHRLVSKKRPTRRELPPSPAERRPAQTPTTPRRPERSPPPVEGDVKIGKGERTVLGVLAQWPQGRTYNELAFLAGYSAKASTLGVILSTLRKAGYVAPGNNPVLLTDEGLDAAGGAQPLPTGQELLDHWLRHPRMGEGERRVLLALIDRYPDDLSHDELCEITGYSPVASTMGVILSKLRKLGLVEKKARQAASEFMQSIS